MPGGQFDWGGFLPNSNGGVRRYTQCGQQSHVERKGRSVPHCSERAEFELNAFEPGIAYALFNSIVILENAARTLRERAIVGLKANPEACLNHVLNSVGIVTALNPAIGYEKSASIAKEALETGKRVGDICFERGYLSREEIDKLLDPKNMLDPRMTK